MITNSEITIIIIATMIVINLIVTGIIGIIKREINTRLITMKLLFIPYGIIGTIIGYFYSKTNMDIDKGKTAIFAGIATIGMGLLIFIFIGFFFGFEYNIISRETLERIVQIALIIVILAIPISIFILSYSLKKDL